MTKQDVRNYLTSLRFDAYLIDSLLPDLTGHDHRPSAFLVYLVLYAAGRPRGKGVAFSYQEIATRTGLAKRTVQLAVRHLANRKLIAVEQASLTATPVYSVLSPWRRDKKN
jgi:hypothetical protein